MTSRLLIPYLPVLDTLPLQEVANSLEDGGARFSVEALNWPAAYPYRPLTVVTAAYSDNCIYLDFLVRCNYLRAVNFTDNSPVSEDSCVEFYVQPDPSSDTYYIFEFNCVGTLNSARCTSAGHCTPLAQEELDRVRRHASVGTRPFQEVEGSFIWSIVAAIPLDILGVTPSGQSVAMRGNFNKCASATSQPHYLSWAPIQSPEPDFHRPDFFGEIVLESH